MKIKQLLICSILCLSSAISCNKDNKIYYKVTWVNYDGTILEVDEKQENGSIPSYDGATPIREKSKQYSYTFTGWSPEISKVSSDITYTAQYKEDINKYTITWKNYDGSVLEIDNDVTYGFTPTYDSDTPKRPKDNEYLYDFNGWEPSIKTVEEDMTYVASYSKSTRKYSIFLESDSKKGSVKGDGNDYKYNQSIKLTATPNDKNIFEGWYLDSSYTNLLSTSNPYEFNIVNDMRIYAKFSSWDERHGALPVIDYTNNTITYGLFPQTIVSPIKESSLINELNKLSPSTYNYVNYNDEYYAKVTSGEPYDEGYKFSDGTSVVEGETYYFKCEPIKWNIISKNDGTYNLDCSNILNALEYGEYFEGKKEKTDYNGNKETVYANNYKYSEIRTYLNKTFYEQAFFLNNKFIIDTIVDNSASSTYSSTNPYVCEDTTDKVFLRSYKDINDSLSLNSIKKVTDFALTNTCYMCINPLYPDYERNGFYWTRSPGHDYSYRACYVDVTGHADYLYSLDYYEGVSPALNISIL